MKKKLEKLKRQVLPVFEKFPEIKLGYVFGSQATGDTGPLSDYDLALYLNPKLDKKKMFDIKLRVMAGASLAFKTDNVDVVILNTCEMPELKYDVIKEGKLIYEKEPFKVLVEPMILNQYFDFRIELEKNGIIENRVE